MDQAAQVREKIDIVVLISEYLPLKKMGRNFTTVCPFHNESSPSFVVSPERQIWHCFGCGKGGDAYTFLMEYENLEFIEALRILAKKAGVELKLTGSSINSSKKEAIYSLNKLASEYYNYVLTKHKAGERAIEYLIKERGLNEKLINTYNIGFAPGTGDALSKYLIDKKKYKSLDLVDAGLSIQKGARTVDFFRNRIIFPLIDHRGNIVGFSGRNITSDDFGPKYINTRDTLAYHKGGMFFGLNQAKDEIKKQGFSIVVEGEFDVISSFKEGITNVVALKGTAFTPDQALLLSRFAPKVALSLDQDSAGIMAMRRSVPILEKRGLLISVINSGGKDPDEAIKENPIEFKIAIKNAREVYDFLIDKYVLENDVNSAVGKKKITDEMLPLIAEIQNEIIKEHYLKKLSELIDISLESLIRQIEKKETVEEEKIIKKAPKQDRREMLEEYLLSLIIQSPNNVELLEKAKDIMIYYKFKIPTIGKIFSDLIIFAKDKSEIDVKEFSKKLSEEFLPIFDKCYLLPLPKIEDSVKYEEEVVRVSKDLRVINLKERIAEISNNLKGEEDEEKISKMREEIANIASQISTS